MSEKIRSENLSRLYSRGWKILYATKGVVTYSKDFGVLYLVISLKTGEMMPYELHGGVRYPTWGSYLDFYDFSMAFKSKAILKDAENLVSKVNIDNIIKQQEKEKQ